MNVLQVLTITTVAYFGIVTVWILKMEEYLENRERDRERVSERGEET
ncbi:hypothetical protein [Halalkalicoccus salilacus]